MGYFIDRDVINYFFDALSYNDKRLLCMEGVETMEEAVAIQTALQIYTMNLTSQIEIIFPNYQSNQESKKWSKVQ